MSILPDEYRPKNLDDLILPSSIKQVFKAYIETKDIPHLLLSGPPGTGKTSLAKVLKNEILESSYDFLFINAALERGIDLMRTKIIDFMSSPPLSSPIKIIVLDEADNMTEDALKSLRSLMESERFKYHNIRFIFTVNYENKLIDAIISRLTKFTFDYVPKDQIVQRAKKILDDNEIAYSEEEVSELINDFYPDIRAVFNYLNRFVNIKQFSYSKDSNNSFNIRQQMKNHLFNAISFLESNSGSFEVQDIEEFLTLASQNELLVEQVIVDILRNNKIKPFTFIIVNRYLNTLKSSVSKILHLQAMLLEIGFAAVKASSI